MPSHILPCTNHDVMNTLTSTAMEAHDDEFRPDFDRQRSNSAPEFPVLDVTATEAVIICSAAAKASDRRLGRRQDRRHVSMDALAERSVSRPAIAVFPPEPELEEMQEEPTPIVTIGQVQDRGGAADGPSLSHYAQTMAVFMQQKIDAIRRASDTEIASPIIPIPDNLLCPSPPPESEDEDTDGVLEISEIKQPHPQPSTNSHLKAPFKYVRPPLRSAFSAWSSAGTTPITTDPVNSSDYNATAYFDLPGPTKKATQRPSRVQALDDTFAPCRLVTSSSALCKAHRNGAIFGNSSCPSLPLSYARHASVDPVIPQRGPASGKPPPTPFSAPIYEFAQAFHTHGSPMKRSIIPITSSFVPVIPGVRKIAVHSPHHYLVEGQVFEICH